MESNHWNNIYKLAEQYYKENGNLLIPHQYTINNIKKSRIILASSYIF